MSQATSSPAKWIGAAALALFCLATAWGQAQDPASLGFKKMFIIEIRNPSPLTLENHPIVLDVETIRAFAPDFNTYYYAVFEQVGREYQFVLTQADDLNKDRYHEEIVLVRTLPPSSTTRLKCYYSPKGSFQLMVSAPKAFARHSTGQAGAFLGWESNQAAFKFVDGRIEVLGKLYAGLVLSKLRGNDSTLQEWGLNVLAGGGSAGLGGLSLWDGATRIPLAGSGVEIQKTVLATGPLRALVKAQYSGIRSGSKEYDVVALFSAYADNVFSRQDVFVTSKSGGPVVFSAGVQKLEKETVTFDKDKGFLAAWGLGTGAAGEVGLSVIFSPSAFAGLDESGAERSVKLNAAPGRNQTYWTIGGWGRGIVTASTPAAGNWAARAGETAAKLRVPVEVKYKAQ